MFGGPDMERDSMMDRACVKQCLWKEQLKPSGGIKLQNTDEIVSI